MKSITKRLEELEKNRPVRHEPRPTFTWYGWEMTEEKEARILRKYPNVFFWRKLSLTLPYGMKEVEGIVEHMEGGMLIWPDPEKKKKQAEELRRTLKGEHSMREDE